MKMLLDQKDARRCPICNTRHAEPRPIFVDVVHCPRCGVPCFFPAGYFSTDDNTPHTVRCVYCDSNFNAPDGGGVVVLHPTKHALDTLRVPTPRGILHNRELRR